jgi:thiamine-monophosphate kinase
MGSVPRGAALTRGGAQAGDELYVSGTLGDAALALAARAGTAQLDFVDAAAVQARLDRPEPRVALGRALRGVASACMDVSDGLLGDLGHLCARSRVAAVVEWPALPCSPALQRQSPDLQQRCALAGGDDYELLFTAPARARRQVQAAARAAAVAVTRIGRIEACADGAAPGAVVVDAQGRPLPGRFASYDHFAASLPQAAHGTA